jgi:hypothetical protein
VPVGAVFEWSTARRRVAFACLVAWLCLGAGAWRPALASASAAEPAAIGRLAAQISTPWPALQRVDGAYSDYVFGGLAGVSRYSESMLGYQQLVWGAQRHDPALIASGFRGVGYAVAHVDALLNAPSVFEELAVASAYNLVRTTPALAADPAWAAQRPAWAAWLQQVRPVDLGRRHGYGNHWLVEANAWLALRATGLSSPLAGTVLNKRARILPTVRAFVAGRIRRQVHLRRVAGAWAGILSDSPLDPLAYQGLSAGMYAHLLAGLGRHAPRSAWRTLAHVVRGSWALTAPDGDLAYSGRSQEQSWAPAFTVYAARLAARHAPPSVAAQDRALSARALSFLARRYARRPSGLALTPAYSTADSAGARLGVDGYAGAPAFAGLTLLGLSWAAGVPDAGGKSGRLFADRDGGAVLDRGTGTFSVSRRGPVWFSVRQTRTRAADHRYRFDFMLAKTRTRGHWRDLIPVPPHTASTEVPGGLALATPWGWEEATGTALHAGGRGVVHAPGGYRLGPALLPSRFTFAARGPGVVLKVSVRRGQTLRYTTWLHPSAHPVVTGRVLRLADATLSLSLPATFTITPGYHSGMDPELDRVQATTTAARSGTLRISIRPRA